MPCMRRDLTLDVSFWGLSYYLFSKNAATFVEFKESYVGITISRKIVERALEALA